MMLLLSASAQDFIPSDSIQAMIQRGEFARARDLLMRQYVKDDADPSTNYWLAILALRDTLYDDAIDYMDVAIEGDNNNADYYFILGSAYAQKSQYAGALSAAFAAPKVKDNWIKALEIDPNHLNARWGLFQYYINAPGIVGGDDEAALKLARDYTRLNPAIGHSMLAFYYARVTKDMSKSEAEIINSFEAKADDEEKAIVRNTNANTLNRIGYHYLGINDYANSYKYFDWAIKIRPDYPNPYDSMGDYYTAVSKFDSALVYYDKALSINPDFAASIYNKGQTLESLGMTEKAILIYRQLIAKQADGTYVNRAKDRLKVLVK